MRNITTIITLVYCLAWHDASSQYFSKLYLQGRPSMLFGSVQTINDKFYVTGVTNTVRTPNYEKAVFGKINTDGSVAFINSIADSDNVSYAIFLNSLKKSADGNLIATGNVTDSVQKAFLMKADTNGNILLWKEYTETGSGIFQGNDIVEIPDSGFLLAINIELQNQISHVLIIRTDTLGNAITSTNFYNGQRSMPQIIRSTLNGHYMVGAFTGDPSNNTPYWSKTWLIEVDRMGNMVREWVDTSRKNLWPNGMEQTADSGWIIVRQHLAYDESDIQAFDGSILKLDKYFNKQWELDTGGYDQTTGMFDVKILSDGNYICVGSDPITLTADSAHDYGWLMKVSQSGEILWQRHYLGDSLFNSYNYLNSISLMSDGGFVAAGQINGTSNGQQGWIIRTDSNGCLVDNCGRATEIEPVNQLVAKAKVYPNPAQNLCILKMEEPDLISSASIFDVLGRTVMILFNNQLLNSYSFDCNWLASGLYFIRVTDKDDRVGVVKFLKE